MYLYNSLIYVCYAQTLKATQSGLSASSTSEKTATTSKIAKTLSRAILVLTERYSFRNIEDVILFIWNYTVLKLCATSIITPLN